MNANSLNPGARAQRQIAALVDRHGALPVIRAVLKAVLGRRRYRTWPDAAGLSDHLRRDVGLPPASASPPLRRMPF